MENNENMQQQPQPPAAAPVKSNVVAGLLGIFLGWLGIHKFYLGYTKAALIMCIGSVVGLAFFWLIIPSFIPTVFWVIGLVEGIMYLTKTPEQFEQIYVKNKKEWF